MEPYSYNNFRTEAYQKGMWGIDIPDTSSYRISVDWLDSGTPPTGVYKDILRTGQIRGNETSIADAYFAKGAPATQFLGNSLDKGRGNVNNVLIEASKRFNLDKHKLYMPSGTGHNSLEWSNNAPYNTWQALTPKENPSFIERVNPLNQKGLKVTEFKSSPYFAGNRVGFEGGVPSADVKFDYTKPFFQTAPSTHAKNLTHIANTLAEQPEVTKVIRGAGTFMNYAGVVPIVTSELRRAKADYENPVTQEVYKKEDVVDLDGRKYTKESVSDMARMHPMNAKNHPEITDSMRYAYHPAWFDEDPAITKKKNEEKWRKETGAGKPVPMETPSSKK